jgi:Pycsar effector protein
MMENTDQLQTLFDSSNKRDVSRARQTFFRTSFKTHITLATMADRKANIMVRLNSILLSALILFYRYIIEFSELSKITILIFILTTLVSLTLAILAVRPGKVGNHQSHDKINYAENIFSFRNFGRIPLKDFEKAFAEVLTSTKLLYGNMIKDLHSYDKVLSKKYRLLRASYTVFLGGLILTVISFILFMNLV